jgi:C1A family cysteine protease
MIPIPNPKKEQLLGGHEMCLIGYDDTKKLFTVMNSWGSSWGAGGLCFIPFDYLADPNLGMQFTIFNL